MIGFITIKPGIHSRLGTRFQPAIRSGHILTFNNAVVEIRYISKNVATLYRRDDPSKSFMKLLWEIQSRVLNATEQDGKVRVGREL
jgi:hypothetical protein